ncbi:carbohydrate ABC transporter permease [Actinomyces sp. HMSC065F12]|uniref:carbohydrate ABC transporter permease n=1 Tax=Actinomyces sp. HMSC065F12 TaxID=1739479 RepID=UPI0008A29C37|nr:carbohydrate ABC transporter permease [Actinomyces sp. HMSC065F12]OFP71464.1 ABC transporter permease [Actinomyces sp. HMSC065F12]
MQKTSQYARDAYKARKPLSFILTKYGVLVIAALVAVLMLAPLYLVVINSFKSPAEYSINGPVALPEQWTVSAFQRYLETVNFPRLLFNSIVTAGVTSLVGTCLSLLAAYALGIGRIKGRTGVVFVLLIATMLPQEALLYPLFYGVQAIGLHNSIWSVVIIFSVLQAAMGTYLLSSVMSTFPREMLEAAQVDGAGRFRVLISIVYPIMRPSLSVLLVFFFVWTWNEFLIPMIMLVGPDSQTLPIALANLKGQNTLDVTQMAAASLLTLLPTLIFFAFFQRTLTRGVTAGAVK